jgi:hypothetical protein
MRYALLIYHNEAANMQMSEAEQQALMGAYNAFTEEIQKRGIMQAGEALQPISTATTVRVREGKTLSTDGPFAETKEQLGGFYIIEAENLDDAIELAAKIPDAKGGSIEVRPLMEFE